MPGSPPGEGRAPAAYLRIFRSPPKIFSKDCSISAPNSESYLRIFQTLFGPPPPIRQSLENTLEFDRFQGIAERPTASYFYLLFTLLTSSLYGFQPLGMPGAATTSMKFRVPGWFPLAVGLRLLLQLTISTIYYLLYLLLDSTYSTYSTYT